MVHTFNLKCSSFIPMSSPPTQCFPGQVKRSSRTNQVTTLCKVKGQIHGLLRIISTMHHDIGCIFAEERLNLFNTSAAWVLDVCHHNPIDLSQYSTHACESF